MLVIVALTIVLSFPAWQLARRRGNDTPLMLGLALPAVMIWIMLTINGYGAQSLSNVVEVFYLFAAGVGLAYAHLFLVGRTWARVRPTALWMMLGLIAAAVLLRTFMPLLPE